MSEKKVIEKKDIEEAKVQTPEEGNSSFFKAVVVISICGMIICLLVILILNISNDWKNIYSDITSIFSGLFVGLIFSLILAIKGIRTYLMRSVASFMSGEEYLKKLSPEVLNDLRDKSYNILYGSDITSNPESLFNYIKRIESKIIGTPHKSIVNEKFIYKYFGDKKEIFNVERTQDFRLHTLDFQNHNSFLVEFKYSTELEKIKLDEFKKQVSFVIEIEGGDTVKVDETTPELLIEYDENTKKLLLKYEKEVTLLQEYTKLRIVSNRLEDISNSFAIASKDAFYTGNYNVIFPTDIRIKELYHNNILYNKKENRIITDKDGNMASININGWCLPGMVFSLVYEKTS